MPRRSGTASPRTSAVTYSGRAHLQAVIDEYVQLVARGRRQPLTRPRRAGPPRTLHRRINTCRFIDVNAARRRSSGCSATRRGCGCCGVLSQRAAERHRADRRARPRAVGRVAPPRPAQGRRPRRRGARRRLHLLPPAAALREATGVGPLWPLLEAQFERARRDPAVRADEARLQEVLRLRKENFDAHAGPDTRDARQLVPGRSWAAWSRALGLLLPPVEVADLGCGEGYLTIEAARWASRVIAVDRSAEVLERARALAPRRAGRRTSSGSSGELEKLPMKDARVDVALLSQALHHARRPGARGRRGGAHHRAGRPRAGARPARARRGVGAREARRPPARLRRRASSRRLLTAPGLADVKVGVGAPQGRRSVHRADRGRRRSPPTGTTNSRSAPSTAHPDDDLRHDDLRVT